MIKTACNECVFAKYETKDSKQEQCGCLADRLQHFNKTMYADPVADFYVLDGVCNMYRQDTDDHIQDQYEDQLEKVRPKITYFVVSSGDTNKIQDTLNSLVDGDVVVANYGKFIPPNVLEYAGDNKTMLVVNNMDTEQPKEEFLSYCCAKIKNSLICVVEAGYNIPDWLPEDLHQQINVDMYKKILFEYEDCYVTYSAIASRVNYFLTESLEVKLGRI